jgi:hypothetical protein
VVGSGEVFTVLKANVNFLVALLTLGKEMSTRGHSDHLTRCLFLQHCPVFCGRKKPLLTNQGRRLQAFAI